jgi:flagellar capping protein FliD
VGSVEVLRELVNNYNAVIRDIRALTDDLASRRQGIQLTQTFLTDCIVHYPLDRINSNRIRQKNVQKRMSIVTGGIKKANRKIKNLQDKVADCKRSMKARPSLRTVSRSVETKNLRPTRRMLR